MKESTIYQQKKDKMLKLHGIHIPIDKIAVFCRTHGIKRLALFGSILRDDFREDSDIDILIEFCPDVQVGLAFFGMQEELSNIFEHSVDLNTPGFLSRYFRNEILAEAEDLYVAA